MPDDDSVLPTARVEVETAAKAPAPLYWSWPDVPAGDPPPAGVAHVPSPRQNVVPDAPVPELRFVTGRFPVTPVVKGSPVPFARVIVGAVPNTKRPEPVSFVIAVARFADVGVASHDAIPAANPEMPVETGRPVAFVKVADAGVPRIGATKVSAVPFVVAPVIPAKVPALLY